MIKIQIGVSGVGVVCPIGSDREEVTEALLQGRDGFQKITGFKARKGKDQAALVTRYKPDDHRRVIKMLRRGVKEALADAGLPDTVLRNTALVMATMAGDSKQAEEIWGGLIRDSTVNRREKMNSLIKYPMSSLLDALALTFQIEGPRTVVSNACASGNIAIEYGMDLLEAGDVEAVIVCGVEALKETMYWGMHGLRILAHELKAFDRKRQGTVLGEGVGVLVLERADNVLARKGRLRGEIAGYGNHCDPRSDSIIPNANGVGLAVAMDKAITVAGIKLEDIDYLNAYGTGTEISDLIETRAIKGLFGEIAAGIPISSSKTFIGNSGGASGILEIIITLIAMEKRFVPPTLHWETRDPELDLDYVPQKGRSGQIRHALSNSIGGGGVNTSIVLKLLNQRASIEGGRVEQSTLSDHRVQEPEEIVVTGLGMFSSLGNRLIDFRANIRKLLESDVPNRGYRCSMEGLAVLEDPFHRANLAARYLLVAAQEAVENAKIGEFRPEEVGIIIGTAFGGYTSTAMELCKKILHPGPNFITPYVLIHNGHNLGATLLSQVYGITGYSATLTSGITAGLDAVIHAVRVLQSHNELKVILVGGVDILDQPLEDAYAYLQNQSGIGRCLGEGAGILVLEKKSSAIQRGVNIYGTMGGYKQGSFPIGRGKVVFDPERLHSGLRRRWMEDNGGIECLFCHIPYHGFDQKAGSDVKKYLQERERWMPVMDLTRFFGEAHAATGILGLVATLTTSWGPYSRDKSLYRELSGHFTLAPGGNYTYVECRRDEGVQ